MKNILIGLVAGILLVVVALGVTGAVAAQTPVPETEDATGVCPMGYDGAYGRGRMMGGAVSGACAVAGDEAGTGAMHDLMVAAFANQLGVTPEELQAELDAGKTMYQVAEEKGIAQEDFFTLMQTARSEALNEAVAQGLLTQEQADWMSQHGFGRMSAAGAGQPGCPMWDGDEDGTQSFGGGMMRGRGRFNSQP